MKYLFIVIGLFSGLAFSTERALIEGELRPLFMTMLTSFYLLTVAFPKTLR
jgi:hypothetical protein